VAAKNTISKSPFLEELNRRFGFSHLPLRQAECAGNILQ
jgi:hypothetical protein